MTTTAAGPRLRADARENRARVLSAARAVFAEQGIDAPMAEIARRAGVGIATLFRRFPTREDLIAEAFADKMAACADAVDAALAAADPWEGFRRVVEFVTTMQASDRGFTRVLLMSFPAARRFEAERMRGFQGFGTLIARAQAAGRLRPDFVPQDIAILAMANAGVLLVAGETAPEAWQRLVAYQLQAFAPSDAPRPTLPPPPTREQLVATVEVLRQRCQRPHSSGDCCEPSA